LNHRGIFSSAVKESAAATLSQVGVAVRVYEKAPHFARIGAGIQMIPNSMKVLRRIGGEEKAQEVRNLSVVMHRKEGFLTSFGITAFGIFQ
jgi:2-polyprenyl-6-methoxyphenol hydroxylase-like FAD-dependent oxidoreductase